MIDVRQELIRSKTVPQVNRTRTHFLTIHYNGPSVGQVSDMVLLKADAKFHVQTRGWDGLAYHYAVGREPNLYQCRDHGARLNHSGVPLGNSESLAALVITGEGDPIKSDQFVRLHLLIRTLNIQPRWILGHQEWPRLTACPGALLRRWLYAYRSEYHEPGVGITIVQANVRDEPDVLSHIVRTLPINTQVFGTWVLGKPVKGDCLWLKVPTAGSFDYVHASTLKFSGAPVWTT